MDWYNSCVKCMPMYSGIECQCCREMDTVKERLSEEESDLCITTNEQFKIVCLNKDVLYTVFVTMKTVRGDALHLPLSNRGN